MTAAAVAETHSGIVFLVGDRAYKMKKAVDLGFLDFSTLERRRVACHREVRLNRRFAPDVYLGVDEVRDGEGRTCEYLVVMRRMPEDRRLSTLASAGSDLAAEIEDLARRLADLHAASPTTPAARASATVEAVDGRWRDLVAGIVADAPPAIVVRAEGVRGEAERYLAGRAPLFRARLAADRARDGHGDLLAEDVFLLEDGPRLLDCLDFDESLRGGDVLADVAFLAMDLERLHRSDLAHVLLRSYQEATGDSWPSSLAHHYVAQRALVRARVAFIRAGQGEGTAFARGEDLLALAARHLEAGRIRLVAVGGVPGAGKSTVAAGLAGALDADLVRSDVVRRARHPDPAGRYDPAVTRDVYETMLCTAADRLGQGRSVVLDATWGDERARSALVATARTASAELTRLECQLAPPIADARIAARLAVGDDASEATPEVAALLRDRWRPWPGAVALDTTGERDAVLEAARRLVRPTVAEEETT